MPNIFSRHKNRDEEPYVRPSLSLQLTRTESIASDATAPNNIGPGRTIGLLLNAAGEKIERFLNNAASRYGLGPQAIFEDLRELRRVRNDRRWSYGEGTESPPTEQEYVIIKKRCRKLLKYCISHMLVTQLEALEAVTALAVEDPYVRQVLAGVLHSTYLIPRYKERELFIGYCKALISVKETEIYNVYFSLENEVVFIGKEMNPRFRRLLDQITFLLKDPDVSFLLGRLILTYSLPVIYAPTAYFEAASENPDLIKWETMRTIYQRGCMGGSMLIKNVHVFLLASQFPVLQLYNIGISSAQDMQIWDVKIQVKKCAEAALNLLDFLCGSECLDSHLQYLNNLDEETQNHFRETVLGNALLITIAHVNASRLDIEEQFDQTYLKTTAVTLLNHFLKCSGDITRQSLAGQAIVYLMTFNRYFKLAMLQCGAAFNMEPSIFRNDLSGFCFPRTLFIENFECKRSRVDLESYDVFYCPAQLWGWLEVDVDHPFDAASHFPVLAGFDTSGKELYVASIYSAYDVRMHSYVPDGARHLTVVYGNGKVRRFSEFKVMILLRDPCDFGCCDIPEGAKLQTGYAYWIRDEDLYRKRTWIEVSTCYWSVQKTRCGTDEGLNEATVRCPAPSMDDLVEPVDVPASEDTPTLCSKGIADLMHVELIRFVSIDAQPGWGLGVEVGDMREETMGDLEGRKDKLEGPPKPEKLQCDPEMQGIQHPSGRRAEVAEKRCRIKAKKQALVDQIRELDREDRELEVEEMSSGV